MKWTAFFLAAFIFTFCNAACNDRGDDMPEVDVKGLIIGKWKMTQFRFENNPWKDSTGTKYEFVNDTLVREFIYGSSCERKYEVASWFGEGLKHVQLYPNSSCWFSDATPFAVVSIDRSTMKIT